MIPSLRFETTNSPVKSVCATRDIGWAAAAYTLTNSRGNSMIVKTTDVQSERTVCESTIKPVSGLPVFDSKYFPKSSTLSRCLFFCKCCIAFCTALSGALQQSAWIARGGFLGEARASRFTSSRSALLIGLLAPERATARIEECPSPAECRLKWTPPWPSLELNL